MYTVHTYTQPTLSTLLNRPVHRSPVPTYVHGEQHSTGMEGRRGEVTSNQRRPYRPAPLARFSQNSELDIRLWQH